MSGLNTNQLETIKNFISNNGGIQRANRYQVQIKFPQLPVGVVEQAGAQSGQDNLFVTAYPSAVSFGGRAINYVYDNLQGYNYGRAVPNSSKYVGGVVLTFLVTGNLFIMNKFYDWMDYLYGKRSVGQSNSYYTTSYYQDSVQPAMMQLDFLNLNGLNAIGKSRWTFKEIYPVECTPMELSAKADTPLLFQVVLNYREIDRITVTQ